MKTTNERLFVVTRVIEKRFEERGVHAALYEMRTESRFDLGKNAVKVYGINWSAIGTVSVEETKKFTAALHELAGYAEVLNALEIVETYEDDPKITNKEEMRAFRERVENELTPHNIKYFLTV